MNKTLAINPSGFEAGLQAVFSAAARNDVQQGAYERFAKLGLPNRRVEGWKWSDINAAMRQPIAETQTPAQFTVAPSEFAALDPIEIQIIDGTPDIPAEIPQGLTVGVVDLMASSLLLENHPLASLNIAMSKKALLIRAESGATVERPILVRHLSSPGAMTFSHILGRADEGAKLKIIESFECAGVFYSSFFQLALRDAANVQRVVYHDGKPDQITHSLCGVLSGAKSQFAQTSLSTGGKLARHETHVLCPAGGAVNDINSVSLVDGERHADFTTAVHFRGPNCSSRQLHKGVASGRGRNVFQGKFKVQRPAQKTDARMTANALLLSDKAEANHKPELEIYADDVECAHGSTCGALDDDALFYLRQRGLSEAVARSLLIEAFVGEAVETIENDSIREVFARSVSNWMEAL